MKLFSKIKKQQNDALLGEIEKTKLALESAYSNFENVIDPDLIDCYIYEVNAIQKRYKFLLKQAKEMDNEYTTI
ncbi:YaaL family protein [Anaerocolumna sp. MB42-C2]|uniref:YaaL family protein n=1 Tax=Anaerocolumna sp. MB42-C2 TaxID=3070997 RepID=UPI0027E05018|nr:YaaL family protein [Anaerocolumna sp. MB42-C2]WMJ85451.1 YaaL family protein [Anaerocolumna sp. MB42-C2]